MIKQNKLQNQEYSGQATGQKSDSTVITKPTLLEQQCDNLIARINRG